MKALALINDSAGGVAQIGAAPLLSILDDGLAAAGWRAIAELGDADTLIEAARRAAGIDAVVCAGGDGTQAAVAGALLGRGVPLLPLPCGTMNLLCRDLGLPMDIAGALAAGLAAPVSKIDACRVEAEEIGVRTFLNNIVFGAYADLAEAREMARDVETLDDLSFAATHAASALANAEPRTFRVTLDGETRAFRSNSLVVSNNPYTGSAGLLPARARLDAGALSVYFLEAQGGTGFAARLIDFLTGSAASSPGVTHAAGRRCTVSVDDGPLGYALDGEPQEAAGPVTMEVLPASLSVRAPAFAGGPAAAG